MPGVISTRVGYSGGDVPTPPTATTAPTPKRSRSSSIPRMTSYRKTAGVLLPDPRSDDHEPPGQRHRHELSLGDLLHQPTSRRRRARHHRRRQRLGPLAGQGRDRGRAGRALLGSRARAPGLPGAHPNGYTCHFVRPNWKLPQRKAAERAATSTKIRSQQQPETFCRVRQCLPRLAARHRKGRRRD